MNNKLQQLVISGLVANGLALLVGCAGGPLNSQLAPQPWAGQTAQKPPVALDADVIVRGQSPDFGGRSLQPISPQEQSTGRANSAPNFTRVNYPPENGMPTYPQYGSGQPAAPIAPYAAPAVYNAPAAYSTQPGSVVPAVANIAPTYYPPAANPNTQANPWQPYQSQYLPPDGVQTAYNAPLPPPGVFDPTQRRYPGDGLTIDGRTPPLDALPLLDFDAYGPETQTGKLMFGVGVNSDAGVVGQIVLDEQNFDWTRWPSSWEDVRNGTAWRGAGQRFRVEAMPGVKVQRYVASFTEPYLWDTPISFSISGSYFTRIYTDWTEQRAGGRVGLGYLFSPDLSGRVTFRGEHIDISNPRIPTPDALTAVLGGNDLFGFGVSLAHDTRDSAFMPTEGHYLEGSFEQVTGTFNYPRISFDAKQYFAITERADGSGRHVLAMTSRVGWSGDNTPLYEHFFAGGYSSLRGFNFRGVGPRDLGVAIGGNFEFINSIEYLFPISADDMVRGVVFTDFGTVENKIGLHADSFRASVGAGLRLVIPAMGQAPIALDFSVPVHMLHNSDEVNNFSFFVGFSR